MEKKKSEVLYDRVSTWRLVAFPFCGVLTNSHYMFFLLFFIIYCTESLGLSAAVVGAMMTLSRILDGITDPIIGLWLDKINTKFGKFRLFCLIGVVIMNVSILGLFWGVKFANPIGTYIWLAFWYFLWVIGYTFCTSSTQSSANILTNDPKQRSWSNFFFGIVMLPLRLFILSFGTRILQAFGGFDNLLAFRKFVFIIIGISLLGGIVWSLSIAPHDTPEYIEKKLAGQKHESYRYRDFFSLIRNNRALSMLIVAASTNKIATTTVSGVTAYFFMIVVGSSTAQSIVTAPSQIVAILGSLVAVLLAVKFGKKKSFLVGTWMGIVALTLLVILRPFSMEPLQTAIFIVLLAFNTMADNITTVNTNSMMPDCCDYENWKNGRYVPGMVQTAFTFLDKLISSFGSLIVGAVISAFGYKVGGAVTPGLYWSIIFLYFGVTILGHIASVIAMKFYPITPAVYEQMTKELNARTAPEAVKATEVAEK